MGDDYSITHLHIHVHIYHTHVPLYSIQILQDLIETWPSLWDTENQSTSQKIFTVISHEQICTYYLPLGLSSSVPASWLCMVHNCREWLGATV